MADHVDEHVPSPRAAPAGRGDVRADHPRWRSHRRARGPVLRLAGCNLTCVWCDTAFSWDPARKDPARPPTTVTVDEVLRRLDPRAAAPDAVAPVVRRIVITGGEPLLQTDALAGVCQRLHQLGWVLEVETSGSLSPGPLTMIVDRFNVSPKLTHSGVAEGARLRWPVLNEFAALPHATFKFVARTVRDLDEAGAILARLDPAVDASRVMVMAEGTDASEVLGRSRELLEPWPLVVGA